MAYIPHFSGAQGVLKYHTSAITFDESTALSAETYGSVVFSCKNVTLSVPKSETEIVQLIGQETVTVGAGIPATGTFQNCFMEEKATGEAKLTCTLILTGDETNMPDFLAFTTGVGKTVATNYKRHTFGDSTSGQTRTTAGAIQLACKNGSEEWTAALANPYVKWGDVKPTAMDGHFEVEIEANCLPKNCVVDVLI